MNNQEQSEKIAQAVKSYLADIGVKDDLSVVGLTEAISKQLPTDREKAFENAADYLCGDDTDVKAMVEAIENHEDGSDFIDILDIVTVWEKVEWKFTCQGFLNEIGL
jgi:hypothetical protein